MFNIASTVEYSLSSMIGNAGEIGNSIYTNRDFEEFLSKRYTNSAEYVAAYQNFLSGTLLENALGMNSMTFTLYTDNDTIVNGGRVNTLDKLKNTESYLRLNEEAKSKGLFFVYDDSSSRITRERRIIYLQRLDFYDAETEKYLKIEFDYGSMVRIIKNMNYDNEVLICEGDRILLSNGQYGSYGSEFQRLDNATIREAYEHTISLYGTDLTIYVKPVENSFLTSIRNELPIILLLLVANVIFPFWFVQIFNRSFTKRITELSRVFKSVDSDHLIPMPCEDGKDEISSMIRNYNRMVERTNGLIETVYKNKIREQEILVGRKNAELLALHSQINPHFLYNTLESIRSEALIAGLVSVADMTEALATFFRYTISKVENLVSVEEELQNCMTYFKIQQYRFGDRLQLSVECDPEEKAAIYSCRIPKLTLQPILENSIIHGTECKLGTGHIRILLEMTESCLLLCISDDGNGMEERKVADINERLQKSGGILATGESETKGGIALVNVNNRIHLLFGEEYGIHVYSMPEIGTDVKIRIPVIYSDRNLIHMEERQENYC